LQVIDLRGIEIVLPLAEEQAFADADLAAGTDQAFPIVGLGRNLAREQNLDAAVEEIPGRRILRTDRLSMGAYATAIEASWKNAGVVENHDIAGVQQVREVAEQAVRMAAASQQVEHAGAVAGGEGFLGNQVVGKMEIEVGDQHGVRL
jgi:hypothetical protein